MRRLAANWFLLVLGALVLWATWIGTSATRRSLASEDRASSLYGWDTSFYYFWLRSIALDFDVDFRNDIEISDTFPDFEKRRALQQAPTENGLVPNKYPIGWAIFHLPWFGLGHGTSLVLAEAGFDVPTDGYGKVYERFIYAGSLLYALVSMWLTYLLLSRYFERNLALAAMALVWMSTFLIYYQLAQHAMSHNLAYLCVVSSIYWAVAVKELPPLKRNWAMLGLSVGLLLIVRPQVGVYLIFPFVLAVVEMLRRRATLKCAAVCLLTMAVPVGLQLLAWKALYGSWLVYSYEGEGFAWGEPKVWESLFDPHHGLFYWHPIFFVGLVGLGFFAVLRDRWTLLWIVSFAATVYVNASWENWWYGVAFGGRAYEGATLFVFFGVAWILSRAAGWPWLVKGAVYAVLLGLAVWNVLVLDVILHSWETGVGPDGPATYGEIWTAVRERFWGF